MAAKKVVRKTARKVVRKASTQSFTAEERAAMRERAQEVKRARSSGNGANDEAAVLAKIAAMPMPDRALGERLHAIVGATAPELAPRLWYGMPAYAKAGKIVCFFQNAHKFKTRYSTLGFSDQAQLDDGSMWPTAFAVTELTAAVEARIAELIRRAVR